MAWRQVNVKDQRKLFIREYEKGRFTMAELCRRFDISRKAGYKWIARYQEEGLEGLRDRSKAPLHQACATDDDLVEQILKVRYEYSDWGPKKVKGWLDLEYPLIEWPSSTTIGKLFDKNGLTVARKYRRRLPVRSTPLAHCQKLNDVWCADFKGGFLTKDNQKCDPFTLTDAHSRFLLRCLKLNANDTDHVWAVLEAAFREYGLPNYLRTDNGPPFASCSAGRLSLLTVKLIKVGVLPDWIEPGKPQQNGRHERMHLTLKKEAAFPGILTLEEQKIKLDEFQHYFNFIRPHEALGQVRPASLYLPSQRIWNGHLKTPEYPDDYIVGKVKSCGKMSWKGSEIYISRTLSEERIGLQKNEEGGFRAYFGPIFLGIINRAGEFEILRRPARKKIKKRGNGLK